MRGAPAGTRPGAGQAGIIPADAGSTLSPCFVDVVHEDHPRGCGEHNDTSHPFTAALGSSPRMRGARERLQQGSSGLGIIPADAGSTLGVQLGYYGTGDHPRGCGEHSPDATAKPRERGSSPRMRGAPDLLGGTL